MHSVLPHRAYFSHGTPKGDDTRRMLKAGISVITMIARPKASFGPEHVRHCFALVHHDKTSPLVLLGGASLFSERRIRGTVRVLQRLSPRYTVVDVDTLRGEKVARFHGYLSGKGAVYVINSSNIKGSALIGALLKSR